jgi:putative transposase
MTLEERFWSKVDRWFPSSKTCSRCGCVKETLSLGERIFHCDECGLEIDRDLNASINLKNLAASSAATACCPERAGLSNQTKLLVGQEPSR